MSDPASPRTPLDGAAPAGMPPVIPPGTGEPETQVIGASSGPAPSAPSASAPAPTEPADQAWSEPETQVLGAAGDAGPTEPADQAWSEADLQILNDPVTQVVGEPAPWAADAQADHPTSVLPTGFYDQPVETPQAATLERRTVTASAPPAPIGGLIDTTQPDIMQPGIMQPSAAQPVMTQPAAQPAPLPVGSQPGEHEHPKKRAHFRIIRLVLFTLVCAIGLWQSYVFLVTTEAGQRLDQAAMLGGGMGRTVSAETASAVLNIVSVTVVAAAIVIAVVIAFLRRRVWVAIAAAALIAGANLTTQVLKHALLVRPDLGVTSIDHNSFPSGHTTVAASISIALIMVIGPKLRPLVAVLGIGYSVTTGVATVIMGWHRPSDVIGAFFVCGLWAGFVMLCAALGRGRPSGSTGTIKGATLVLTFAGLVAAAAGAAIGWQLMGRLPTGAVWHDISALSRTDAGLTFVASVLVIGGVAAFVEGGVMGLISGTKKR